MSRISEVERPGLALRVAYRIGERMFGVVPTPEKAMAHRPALMVALGGLHTALERCGVMLENLALRHQLAVLQRTVPRPRLRTAGRPASSVHAAGCVRSRRPAESTGRTEVGGQWIRLAMLALPPRWAEIRTNHVGPCWGVRRCRGQGRYMNGRRRSSRYLDGLSGRDRVRNVSSGG
jgi:hypothetical protein